MNELIKNYRKNDELRHSFNELAKATFGLDFEDWYQNGYWGENYIPYSIVKDGNVIANVSVNITDMNWKGSKKHFIQLGTVMTAESYRNQAIYKDYRSGMKVVELACKYYLSEKSIQRIIRTMKL